MYKFKVCMLGAFAVGKTSLVQRYVNSLFDERYHTTLGVKIDKKTLEIDGQPLQLILWDLAGEDEFMKVRATYLRGASGLILVADGLRPETLDTAIDLWHRFNEEQQLPFILAINKADEKAAWQLPRPRIEELRLQGWPVLETSAKTAEGVEDLFQQLGSEMLLRAKRQGRDSDG